jgi:heme/copper-type cytochrome/quinol oxidase subunit 3
MAVSGCHGGVRALCRVDLYPLGRSSGCHPGRYHSDRLVLAEARTLASAESYRTMEQLNENPVLDVSDLPTVVFGPSNVVWLGTLLFMLIEGSMMAMLIASYFYLRTRSDSWPPTLAPPDPRWGIANAAVFLASVIPAHWVKIKSRAGDLRGARRGLAWLELFCAINVVLRVLEFSTLNCRWSDNAYASVVWMLMGTHSAHVATEFVETLVLLVLASTDRVDGNRLVDFDENSDYWYFVVGVALLMDVVVYGASRFL